MDSDGTSKPPFETAELRRELKQFLDKVFKGEKIGDYQFGVYAFFDYDGEPIYVGQTREKVRTRIRRHLTNQRTDAVAMSVLDPFEVFEIEVWPLGEYNGVTSKNNRAKYEQGCQVLDALEFSIFEKAIRESKFNAILNEKDPPVPGSPTPIPDSFRDRVVSEEVNKIRRHPDFRISRRALTLSRLAQVISERQVQDGLRRTLLTQAKRLQWLAERRMESVSTEEGDSD